MLLLGLQGSPRQKGNTSYLLSVFMDAAEKLGAETHTVHVTERNILPCREYIVCEKKGFCPIDDDMKHEIYPLLRKAEAIVAATPIFFYNATAQLKALIDRSQTLWARKYKLNLTDPHRNTRRGYLLAVGATKGKNLFEGLKLTTAYFFDAVGASFEGSLTYRHIEHPGDMEKHPTVLKEAKDAAEKLLNPLLGRKKILFISRENACLSQMASAYAQQLAGDTFEVISGGTNPADKIHPLMEKAMREKGIDMAFRSPISLESALKAGTPDKIITIGPEETFPAFPNVNTHHWNLPDTSGKPIDFIRDLRNEIEKRVTKLMGELITS